MSLRDHNETLGYNSVFKKDLFKNEVVLVTGGGTGKNNQLHTFSLVLKSKKNNNLRLRLRKHSRMAIRCVMAFFLISVPDFQIDRDLHNQFASVLTSILCVLLVRSLGIGRCIAHELAR
jgi:hypothetical protein